MPSAGNKSTLGLSGKIAAFFYRSHLTPLLALVGLFMGIFATLMTPKEEDPQIDVTFANVFIAYPGASAAEVESVVTFPVEKLLSEIKGIKHIFSTSNPGMSIIGVQFKVGEPRSEALVRLYNKLYSHQDFFPSNMGIRSPLIKPQGIDEVPVLTLTFTSDFPQKSAFEVAEVVRSLEPEIKRISGTNEVKLVGASDRVVHVEVDLNKMALMGVSLTNISNAIQSANTSKESAAITQDNQHIFIQSGAYLSSLEEFSSIIVAVKGTSPVYLGDVATVAFGSDDPTEYVWLKPGLAAKTKNIEFVNERSAITLSIAKQSGVNAMDVSKNVLWRIEQLKGTLIPPDIKITVTRDYGKTATDKANLLIEKLFLVTLVVVVLVGFALGIKEAIVVGLAVVITLAMTLFASWAFGFTINRVSLFALIFAIGILVDDAIVVVENIHRHKKLNSTEGSEIIPLAIDEVGEPTILATLAVMAALLPMAFVSGLMGPYMNPIPINASAGMFISLIVAFALTPWLMNKIYFLKQKQRNHDESTSLIDGSETPFPNRTFLFFEKLLSPFMHQQHGAKYRLGLLISLISLILISISLIGFKSVVLKMLPFDNKSEFQVMVDLPEKSSLEKSTELLHELVTVLENVEEITDVEVYAGTAAPINFNGLVRQYYLRQAPYLADIQVNLTDKHLRSRHSHEIAKSIRAELYQVANKYGALIKVVEVPPGPPVLSPIVAEVYGNTQTQRTVFAKSLTTVFNKTQNIVDVDNSLIEPSLKKQWILDRQKASLMGISQLEVVSFIDSLLAGSDVSYLHSERWLAPVPIRLEWDQNSKSNLDQLLTSRIMNHNGESVALADLGRWRNTVQQQPLYHKDLLPLVYVVGDGAGELDSPLYGMLDIKADLEKKYPAMEQALVNQPNNPYQTSIKWDGEWQITYDTFRDMGLAYAVGLIIIYLLIVAKFSSYTIPLIIMAPIPLTLVGILPGHALLNSQFTATSMIGMIALAGILVRNSILLVDFIELELKKGASLQQAVIQSAAIRSKPILLTAMAAILDALFILDDPIFNGLAISLIFGVFVSTLMTLVVVPVVFYASSRSK